VIKEYADDEANTETVTTFDMLTTRIHNAHASPEVRVEYAVSTTDADTVTYVRAVRGGAATEYFKPGVAAPPPTLRTMDCLSCHSRPAHAFGATAERTVNDAMGSGALSRALPYLRRESVALLKAGYESEAAGLAAIEQGLTKFYSGKNASSADVTRAIAETQRLFKSNVFPEMKITWGTHPVQIGHTDFPGCFRCHSDELKAPSGKLVSQDCEICHKQR
jgi:hypothetical protein